MFVHEEGGRGVELAANRIRHYGQLGIVDVNSVGMVLTSGTEQYDLTHNIL